MLFSLRISLVMIQEILKSVFLWIKGVSGDKIELDPTSANVDQHAATTTSYFSRHSVLFSKQKSLTLQIDSVAACFIHQEHTSTGRRVQLLANPYVFYNSTLSCCIYRGPCLK